MKSKVFLKQAKSVFECAARLQGNILEREHFLENTSFTERIWTFAKIASKHYKEIDAKELANYVYDNREKLSCKN